MANKENVSALSSIAPRKIVRHSCLPCNGTKDPNNTSSINACNARHRSRSIGQPSKINVFSMI